MNEFTIHPDVYKTGGKLGLVDLLIDSWTQGRAPGTGTIYVVSGFGNYNGGVRFFDTFRKHTKAGGKVVAFFAGSANARLTSRQLVEELLRAGVEVTVVNRKRLLHAKVYGVHHTAGDRLVVSSGNFTGPGMTQNVEASVALDEATTGGMGFSWSVLEAGMRAQTWDYYYPKLSKPADPAWQMLYDEVGTTVPIDESELTSMVVILGHADTVRINAAPGTSASLGTQYFWLSKDAYGFFPALTIVGSGRKTTYSAMIKMNFVPVRQTADVRVTFEAENNLDFRLGTGLLRATSTAKQGDIAVISRRGEREYDLRIVRKGTRAYTRIKPYATNFIGHAGKKYGYVPNSVVDAILP